MSPRQVIELIGIVAGIAVSLIAIVKGIAALVQAIVDFVASIRELTTAVTQLTKRFDKHTEEVLDRLHANDSTLGDHETRISVLEDWRDRPEAA